MQNSIISTKGQVVVPHALRKRYRLKPRSKVRWLDLGYALLLVPSLKDPLSVGQGILKDSPFTLEALKADRRAEKQRDNK